MVYSRNDRLTIRNCEEINFRLSRRMNFPGRGRGVRHSGAMPNDDNEVQGNLDK
jgi:hypothetical protein